MIKDPDAKLDFGFDWKPATHGKDEPDWLEADETIVSYVITVPAGLTKVSDTQADGIVTVWLSGGTVDEWYKVACKITTSKGRVEERTIYIQVQER